MNFSSPNLVANKLEDGSCELAISTSFVLDVLAFEDPCGDSMAYSPNRSLNAF
jgi:hypothetical protein